MNKDPTSRKLLAMGTVVFAIGLFFSYGIVIFGGVLMMVAGLLPPSGKE